MEMMEHLSINYYKQYNYKPNTVKYTNTLYNIPTTIGNPTIKTTSTHILGNEIFLICNYNTQVQLNPPSAVPSLNQSSFHLPHPFLNSPRSRNKRNLVHITSTHNSTRIKSSSTLLYKLQKS